MRSFFLLLLFLCMADLQAQPSNPDEETSQNATTCTPSNSLRNRSGDSSGTSAEPKKQRFDGASAPQDTSASQDRSSLQNASASQAIAQQKAFEAFPILSRITACLSLKELMQNLGKTNSTLQNAAFLEMCKRLQAGNISETDLNNFDATDLNERFFAPLTKRLQTNPEKFKNLLDVLAEKTIDSLEDTNQTTKRIFNIKNAVNYLKNNQDLLDFLKQDLQEKSAASIGYDVYLDILASDTKTFLPHVPVELKHLYENVYLCQQESENTKEILKFLIKLQEDYSLKQLGLLHTADAQFVAEEVQNYLENNQEINDEEALRNLWCAETDYDAQKKSWPVVSQKNPCPYTWLANNHITIANNTVCPCRFEEMKKFFQQDT